MIADFSTAMLIRAIGYRLQLAYSNSITSLGISKLKTTSSMFFTIIVISHVSIFDIVGLIVENVVVY